MWSKGLGEDLFFIQKLNHSWQHRGLDCHRANMWWSLLEISWRSFFSFNEEHENKFETERCTENFQAKFDEMEMLEQVLTKGAFVAARHRVCCSEAGRKTWMDIEHHAVLHNCCTTYGQSWHSSATTCIQKCWSNESWLAWRWESSPSISTNVNTAGNGWKHYYQPPFGGAVKV